MNKKKNEYKFLGRKIILNKIEANNLDLSEWDESEIEVIIDNPEIKKINYEENEIIIKVNTCVKLASLLEMKLVHNIFLKFNDIQTYETEIKEDINKFVEPIGAEISYTVAFISKKMTGQHIILPPSIGFGEKGYKE